MSKVHVKRDDTVIIISGDDKGKKGKVLEVSPKEGKIIVQGVNMVKKHVKPRSAEQAGGIIDAEAAFYACKAQLYCSKCKKATRAQYKVEGDKKTRVCAKCGAEL